MKERPILFNGEMVRAVLDGSKTQTRRVIKPQPELGKPWKWWTVDPLVMDIPIALCPYGIPGDRLWVRETWRQYDRRNECECYDFCYCPPTGTVIYRSDRDDDEVKWRPSIHMPHWASRITLEITDVRVERVQEISQSDAYSEGVMATDLPARHIGPVSCFAALWDSIYSQRGYGWDANPWVWVVEFVASEDL